VLVLRGIRRGGSRDIILCLRMRMCGACVSLSPGMRANPSTCGVLTSVGTQSGSGRWCTFGRTAGRATRPEWICSQGFYFEPKAGGEVRIFGFYNKKKKKKKRGQLCYPISMETLICDSTLKFYNRSKHWQNSSNMSNNPKKRKPHSKLLKSFIHCSMLQHAATHCNTMQCAAHCHTL